MMSIFKVRAEYSDRISHVTLLVQAKSCEEAARKGQKHAQSTADPGVKAIVVSVEMLGQLDVK